MAAKDSDMAPQGSLGYKLFIAALSILSIVNLVLGSLFVQEQDLQYILGIMNAFFLPIFLGDFLWRLSQSPSKSQYFFHDFGWADLLSSLPFTQTKILRIFRLWRVGHLFREFGPAHLWRDFVQHRADNALLTVVFLMICVVEFGALAVLKIEEYADGANITSAPDAIWYVYVTITTVGYGDRYPVTNTGRFVGMLIMTAGVGLFGTLAGFLSNKLLTPAEEKTEPPASTPTVPVDPQTRAAELRRLLEAQAATTIEMRARLDELDRLLLPKEKA